MRAGELKQNFQSKKYDDVLLELYEDAELLPYQYERYIAAIDRYIGLYGDRDVEIYTAAGRSEICGNHTDHQRGCVLAASINLDIIAVVSKSDRIRILSDDMAIKELSPDDLEKKDEEAESSEALIKGVLYKLQSDGYGIGGFDAYMTSDVLRGSGLSSSAAFETVIGTIISGLYNNMSIDMVTIAKAGQFAENIYFGKPSGLMDQCACAVGGLIGIDFKNKENPEVKSLSIDFSKYKHSLCIVDTKGSHADLTCEYAAVPGEMRQVAQLLGCEVLGDASEQELYDRLPEIREKSGDRAVLRSMHFFDESRRVRDSIAALEADDFELFKSYIQASGNSSYKLLQNIYAASDAACQPISIGLAVSERILQGNGICRIHGGGFAGTIQAFVRDEFVPQYKAALEAVFGEGSCHVLKIRKYGGKRVI